MGRPVGTKNNMRSAEEKKAIVLEYLNDKHQSQKKTADKYGVSRRIFQSWSYRYREHGIDGLRNQTGKTKHPGKGNPLRHASSRPREGRCICPHSRPCQ